MASFQFYNKDSVSLHLDTNSRSFTTESEQLIEQGFEPIGDIIEAKDSRAAHEKFKSIYLNELKNFAKSQVVVGVLTAGSGGL